jgi:hypothetical protein
VAGTDTYKSANLDASYANALPASSQLVLGTLTLEGTPNAVTLEQAKALLPLWQAISGGAATTDAERNAVLKQIEGTMTREQLAAIAALKLTADDLQTWMQEQGMSFGPPDGSGGSYPNPGRTPNSGNGQGGTGGFGNMTDAERAALRATMEAGGFTPRNGGSGPSGPNVGSGRQSTFLIRPLLELLAVRAGVATPRPTLPVPTPPSATVTP